MAIVGIPGSPVLSTVRDLLIKAFTFVHIVGAGESLTVDESSNGLAVLNGIIEQANIDKLLGYFKTEIIFPFVPNQLSYTIGPASTSPNVIAPRPVQLLSAFARRQDVDLPIFVGDKLDYDRIQQKQVAIAGWQQMVYYETTWPKGTLFFYMKPLDNMTEAHLTAMAEIAPFSSLDDSVSLPPVYTFWMIYKTGQRLCPEYGMKFTQEMKDILIETEASLKRNNMKPFPVAGTGLSNLAAPAAGHYNVYADNTRQ